MEDKKEKLLDRVRRLMAMAQDSSSPNEAAIAARRARALMDRYDITMAELKEVTDHDFGTGFAGVPRRKTPLWEQHICVRVAQYNDCQVKFCYAGAGFSVLEFQGLAPDVEVARYMFDYLVKAGKRQCSAFVRMHGGNANAFKAGFGDAICKKFREMIAERDGGTGKDLVVAKKGLVEQHFGVVKYKQTNNKNNAVRDVHAYRNGIAAGERTSIHTGVNSSKRTQLSG